MKHLNTLLFLLLSLVVSYHSVAQGSLAALDAKNGFRDAKFGMRFSQFKGMVLYKGDKLGAYVRTNDKKMIGEIPLKYIKYKFHNGILYDILIMVNYKYKDDLISTLEDSYGKSNKDSYNNTYWETSKINMSLYPTLLSDDGIDGILLAITDIQLEQKARAEDWEGFVKKHNSNYEKQAAKRKADL